ncbi:hypothetical protein ACFX13_016969 [Malus domestica]
MKVLKLFQPREFAWQALPKLKDKHRDEKIVCTSEVPSINKVNHVPRGASSTLDLLHSTNADSLSDVRSPMHDDDDASVENSWVWNTLSKFWTRLKGKMRNGPIRTELSEASQAKIMMSRYTNIMLFVSFLSA